MKTLNHTECMAVSGAGYSTIEYSLIGACSCALGAALISHLIGGITSDALLECGLGGALLGYSMGYAINYGPLGKFTKDFSQEDIARFGVFIPSVILSLPIILL